MGVPGDNLMTRSRENMYVPNRLDESEELSLIDVLTTPGTPNTTSRDFDKDNTIHIGERVMC